MEYNWEEIMLESDYKIALELNKLVENKEFAQLQLAMIAFIQSTIKKAQHDLYSELKNLMILIIEIKFSNKLIHQENWNKILELRQEIEFIKEDYPPITDDYITTIWDSTFFDALNIAEIPKKMIGKVSKLTYEEVFLDSYHPNKFNTSKKTNLTNKPSKILELNGK
jgi:hypothetical protein